VSATLTLEAQAEAFRAELIGYCYRYFGSYAEAEDAVQETIVRAWQHSEEFAGRASLRTWLYKIATNICLDMKRAPQRRCLPMDLSGPGQVPDDPATLATRPEPTWVGPIADYNIVASSDPADTVVMRESIRLAFITALQVLPARQRVVLILRDVLAWSAQECADLLDSSVASVNSALARARKTVSERGPVTHDATPAGSEEAVLINYVEAFEAYDVERLVRLLTEDASFSMPPFRLWLRGVGEIGRWWRGPGQVCRNSRTIACRANDQPAVAVYHDVGEGRWEPFAIHVLDSVGGRISAITHFMGPAVFAEFGLPDEVVEQV
jgi:RNA polymerase sigma-70 factor (ECF subfamily)